jgi:hypothetical protein
MNRHVQPEDSDLYALGALDGEEKQALEAHVRLCAECAREVEAARQRVALLGLAAPAAAPAARVKEELLRRVRAERIPEMGRAVRDAEPRRGFGFGWLTPAFGVATVVFAALAGMFWMRDARDLRRIHALEGQLAEVQTRSQEIARASQTTDKLLEMPTTKRVALMPMPGMERARGRALQREDGDGGVHRMAACSAEGQELSAVAGSDGRQADASVCFWRGVDRAHGDACDAGDGSEGVRGDGRAGGGHAVADGTEGAGGGGGVKVQGVANSQ